MSNVNSAVNPALSDTRSAIEAVKSAGRNAEHCYEPTRQRLSDASKAAFSALNKCVSKQLDTLTAVEENIATHLTNGKLLLSSLDRITITCASGNAMQAQVCVANNMPGASESVRNFKNAAEQLKDTGNSLSSAGEIGAIRCFPTPMSKMYEDVASARINSTKCIREAAK